MQLKDGTVQLGIRSNLSQFIMLVILTAFVGGMIGMERSLLPRLAEREFHIASKTAMFSFIMAFGITKAITNYFTGTLSNKFGRHRLLIAGFMVALPIPWILMYAENWNWIICANILLGLNQGLAWSSTLVMKIDLVGEKGRGVAVGLNEFAGYLAVGLVTFLVAYLASVYGLRPYPFFTGVVFSVIGLVISIFFIKDTRSHMEAASEVHTRNKVLKNIFWGTSFYDRNLSSVSQAGLTNNLNDGMIWGLYPLLLSLKGFSISEIGAITAIYPAVWGIGQLFTGKISNHVSRKMLLVVGMALQAIILLILSQAITFSHFIILSIILGISKAIVYPTFAIAIADNTHPQQRAESIGVFRFWRDGGYAVGAFLAGVLSDSFGITTAIICIGCLTMISSLIVQLRMKNYSYKLDETQCY